MAMTEEERKMLKDLHSALLEVPPGSPEGKKPLLEEIRAVTEAYKRANWITRAVVWLLPALAGIGVAIQQIKAWGVWR